MKAQPNVVNSHNLWHSHLEHPSIVPSLLPKTLGVSSHCKNKQFDSYDVCFRANQNRSKFIVSKNKVNDLFDIIHCNSWGSCKIPSLCGAHYFLTIIDDANRAIWIYLMR